MASFPFNNTTFQSYGNFAPSSNYAIPFQFDLHKGASRPPCFGCNEASIEAGNLRVRIAELDAQLLKAQKENADADSMIRYLLRINSEKDERSAGNITISDDSNLIRKISQATTERECLKVMLDHAFKKIVEQQVQLMGFQTSKPSICQDTGDLLGDLLGFEEAAGATNSILPSAAGNETVVGPQETEPDADLLDSYICHFVEDHKSSNETSDDDKIILTTEKTSKDKISSSLSDIDLTAENSASSSPLVMANVPTQSSLEPTSSNNLATTLGKTALEAGQERKKLPEFFNYGLQYRPVPDTWNILRTLVIANIPAKANMTAVLHQVRGGLIVDAKLLDTTSITGAKTAMVTFLHERTAIALEMQTKKYPIIIDGQVTQTTVLKSPTWPCSIFSLKGSFDGTRTRCLEIAKYPRQISPTQLRRKLEVCSAMKWDRIEHMGLRDDGVLVLRFESIASALQAQSIFSSSRVFRGCVIKFAPDPCVQPLVLKGVGDHENGLGKAGSKAVAVKAPLLEKGENCLDDGCKTSVPPPEEVERLSKVE